MEVLPCPVTPSYGRRHVRRMPRKWKAFGIEAALNARAALTSFHGDAWLRVPSLQPPLQG